jgi:hypothetical protein
MVTWNLHVIKFYLCVYDFVFYGHMEPPFLNYIHICLSLLNMDISYLLSFTELASSAVFVKHGGFIWIIILTDIN